MTLDFHKRFVMDKIIQDNQLNYLEHSNPKKHELVCNDCQCRVEPENFGDCLAFYEAHPNHSTFIKKIT